MANRRGAKRGIAYPVTVRQAQKLMSGGKAHSLIARSLNFAPYGFEKEISCLLACLLAKLASKNPNQILIDADGNPVAQNAPEKAERQEGESREKGTDETAPSSDNPSEFAEKHGGDGNSGETDSQAQTQSPEQREGSDGSQQQNSGNGKTPVDARNCSETDSNATPERSNPSRNPSTTAGEDSEASTDKPDSTVSSENTMPKGGLQSRDAEAQGSINPQSDKDKSEWDGSAKAEEQQVSDNEGNDAASQEEAVENVETATQDLSDLKGNDAASQEEEGATQGDRADEKQNADDIPAHQKKWGKSFGKAEKAKLSTSASSNRGTATAELKGTNVDNKLLKLCRQKLAALVSDASSETSPRRDYTEFCVRLKTYRNPSPARKEEEGRPVILVLADISGSCASFSEQSVKVAKSASKLGVNGADVMVITHDNGQPYELEVNGKAIAKETIGKESRDSLTWYDALLKRYQVQVVISLGDWDGSYQFAHLINHPQIERFIWLDNAHCNNTEPRDRTKPAITQLVQQNTDIKGLNQACKLKMTYTDACKDAIAFINNIK